MIRLLNTQSEDYDSIIESQKAIFDLKSWATNFVPRLSLDWTKSLIELQEEFISDCNIATYTEEETLIYLWNNSAEWTDLLTL